MLLEDLISKCEAAVLYTPIKEKGEIDWKKTDFPIKIPDQNILVPQSREENPFEWADKVKELFANKKLFILIPGRKFDKYGTRHGNGGGWYDRFLSKLPRKWLRIGVCNIEQFSTEPIERKAHDEPVNWMIVKRNEKLFCIKASKFPFDHV